jgi:CHAD domain-containing protein
MAERLQYALPATDSLHHWEQKLCATFGLASDGASQGALGYYDSFDWRLFCAGETLEWQRWNGEGRLRLLPFSADQALLELPWEERAPRFPSRLPQGAMRERLADRLGLRALLPIAEIAVRRYCLKWLDSEEKTHVRVYIDELELERPGSTAGLTLARWLRIEPLRGYEKTGETLVRHLEASFAFPPDKDTALGKALVALGRTPGDYSSKLSIALEPTLPAHTALRRILISLLVTMEANEEGVIEDWDTEFLHDFRVAVRRTRSALGQLKRVFPAAVLDPFRAEFGWLGTITGPTRDLHVYLLKYEDYRGRLPEELRADLEPLRDFLARHLVLEHNALAEALRSERYGRLKTQWRLFLTTAAPESPDAVDAALPVAEVAARRTWRMYKRVLREGGAITPDSPAPELHELRKSCKKLRYLMEFFQSLYPPQEIRGLIKELKKLQDNLGDFQDLDVQIQTLKGFTAQMQREAEVGTDTLLAMGALLKDLQEGKVQIRSEFQERFARFAARANQERFRALFHPADAQKDSA